MVYLLHDVQCKYRDQKKKYSKINISLTIKQSIKFISLLNNLIFDTQLVCCIFLAREH